MKLRLSLPQKGLILVTVPLFFQLAVIGVLDYLTLEATTARKAAERSAGISDKIDRIQQGGLQLYDLVDTGYKGEAHFLKGDFDSSLAEKEREFKELFRALRSVLESRQGQRIHLLLTGSTLTRIPEGADLTKIPLSVKPTPTNDPTPNMFDDLGAAKDSAPGAVTSEIVDDVEIVRRAEAGLQRAIDGMHAAQRMYREGTIRDNEKRRALLKKMRRDFEQLVPLFRLAKLEAEFEEEQVKVLVEFDAAHQFVVIAGTILLVAITVAMFQLYSRRDMRRLKVVLDNSMLLASNKPLRPIMRGDDEIATLDHAFHSMADAISQAADKERAIVTHSNDVMFSLDERGSFSSINAASQRIFGYEPDELIGNKLINLAIDSNKTDVLNALKLTTELGDEPPFEFQATRKDGRIIELSCSAQFVAKQKSIFCVARDITEQKRAERLRQEVVQMVSHDLKTPLSTVRSFLEMLEAGMFGSLSERGEKLLKLADNSTVRMLTLIRDLLDIEKMEAGMLTLQKRQMLFNEVFDQAVSAVGAPAAAHGVRVIYQTSNLHAFADPDRVVQILINLLTNAIKFSPQGQTVEVQAIERSTWIEVRVTDHGRGIPREKIGTIFDRFSQVKASDATEKGGSGLGLAICKALVELHGGTIFAESEENQGTMFVFTLPVAAPEYHSGDRSRTTIEADSAPTLDPDDIGMPRRRDRHAS